MLNIKEPLILVFLQCLEVVKDGLSDPEVRPSRRYLLYQRAEKICSGSNSKFMKRLAEIEPFKVTEAPEVCSEDSSQGCHGQGKISGK